MIDKTDGARAYQVYNAVRLHFNSDSYDFIKYQGKTRNTIDSYLRQRPSSKFIFNKIQRQYSQRMPLYFAAQTAAKNFVVPYVYDLMNNDAHQHFIEAQKYIDNCVFMLEGVLEKIDCSSDFKILDHHDPVIFDKCLTNEISIHSLPLFEQAIGFCSIWETKGSPLVIKFAKRIKKYSAFVNGDKQQIRKIIKKHVMGG